VRANAQKADGMLQGGMMAQEAGRSLPERLDSHEKSLAAWLDALRAVKGALKPFYAVLSDEQKRLADQLNPGLWGWA
jgi:hypothetical protein